MSEPPRTPMSLARLALGVVAVALGAVVVAAGLVALAGQGGEPGTASGSASLPATAARPTPAHATTSPSPAPSGTVPGTLPPASAAAGDPILVGAGDIGRCDGTADEATAELVEGLEGAVFVLGDNAYERGTPDEFRDCYGPSWGRLLDRTRFAVAGNHDYGSDDAAGHRAYFGASAERDGVTWFSEEVGAWHVIVLDGNCGELPKGCGADSPQLQWLAADLASSHARCTLAMWHQPRFSSGEHGNDQSVAPLWDALYAAGADLVLNGHDHDYERFAPQDPAGRRDRDRGITEIVVGTGGAPLRGFGPPTATSVVRSSLAHGVLQLTLHASGWSFRFVSIDGSFSDQGNGTCH